MILHLNMFKCNPYEHCPNFFHLSFSHTVLQLGSFHCLSRVEPWVFDGGQHLLGLLLSFMSLTGGTFLQMGPGFPVTIPSLSAAADDYSKAHVS